MEINFSLQPKKQAIAEMELMNVDNFPIFTGNSETENFEVSGQVITKFTFQSCKEKSPLEVFFSI